MSFLGGIARSLINPATLVQLAAGPAGWASLAARVVVSAAAQQLIQQVGERIGASQGQISAASSRMLSAAGLSPAEQRLDRAVERYAAAQDLSPREALKASRELDLAIANAANEAYERSPGKKATAQVKGGWLMAIAEAMGRQLDIKGQQLTTMAGQITDKTPSLTTKFQAASQEFGLMMNALTTVIKSVGEGMQNASRKG